MVRFDARRHHQNLKTQPLLSGITDTLFFVITDDTVGEPLYYHRYLELFTALGIEISLTNEVHQCGERGKAAKFVYHPFTPMHTYIGAQDLLGHGGNDFPRIGDIFQARFLLADGKPRKVDVMYGTRTQVDLTSFVQGANEADVQIIRSLSVEGRRVCMALQAYLEHGSAFNQLSAF